MTLGTDGSGPYTSYPRPPEPPAPPAPPPASTTKATWAFALGLIPTPITLPIAFGLGISVLNAGRDGRDHGRKRAIAAVLLASFWGLVAFTAGYVALGLAVEQEGEHEVESGTARATTGLVRVHELTEGDCLADDKFTKVRVRRIEVVPCSDPHRAEVYSTYELDEADYPGDDEAAGLADEGCLTRLEGLTGMSWEKMSFEMSYYYPTESTWDADRLVTCIAVLPERQSGTLEDLAADELADLVSSNA